MDKEDVVYINNVILLSHKKEWNNAIGSNMDGPRDYHIKWNKSDRERQIWYHLYVKSLRKGYKCTYKTEIDSDIESKFMVTKGGGERDKLGVWDWHIHTTI